jgi:hypothetical protein
MIQTPQEMEIKKKKPKEFPSPGGRGLRRGGWNKWDVTLTPCLPAGRPPSPVGDYVVMVGKGQRASFGSFRIAVL